MKRFRSICPICDRIRNFVSEDDFWSGRSGLYSNECEFRRCITRERALAFVMFKQFSRYDVINRLSIREAAPSYRGLSMWLLMNSRNYVRSGYYNNKPFGSLVDGMRNEDLESQTFGDETFDLVIHLDVMEHLFNPFKALREIHRSLKPDGMCLFCVPTYWDRLRSQKVASLNADGTVTTVGEPEYHGNPQSEKGSLVTWRYGYDLPLLITRETDFDVELRRFQATEACAIGTMTEVYILTKKKVEGVDHESAAARRVLDDDD